MMLQRGCLSGTKEDFGRRDFIKVGSLGFLGITLSQALQREAAMAAEGAKVEGKAKSCILVFLEGGPSQIDTWDPKANNACRPISAANQPAWFAICGPSTESVSSPSSSRDSSSFPRHSAHAAHAASAISAEPTATMMW